MVKGKLKAQDTEARSTKFKSDDDALKDYTYDEQGDEDDDDEEVTPEEEDEDEDDDTGIESMHTTKNGESEPYRKKQKTQLSAQDIQVARETAELFKSNIFKLQIDELVKETKIKDTYISIIERVLHKLHSIIIEVPPVEGLSLQDAEKLFSNKRVTIPFPDPKPSNVNYTFSYLPPEDISLVGSFGLKTTSALSEKSSIDVALTMPRSLFSPKDYLNYRSLYKRAFYLAYLADNLISLTKKKNLPVKMSYKFANEDILCPIITMESIDTSNSDDLIFKKTKFTINLIVGFPLGLFDSKKLLPDRNCVRVQHESNDLPPTPIYNGSLLSLSTYGYYLQYLYAAKKSAEAFKDTIVLGKLWLQQRNFGSSFSKGGFGHFEFAMLLAALLNGGSSNGGKILLHGFSSYQLFKGTIKYLGSMDLCSGYLSFSSKAGDDSSSKYHSNTDFNVPTLFDKSTKLNVLWKMSRFSYQSLKKCASETFSLLNDMVNDRFDPILLQKADFYGMKFDLLLDFEVPEEVHESYGPLETISFITFQNYIKNRLYGLLSTGLGKRVSQIFIKESKVNNTFSLNKRKHSEESNKFTIGLSLNAEEAEKLLTKGPKSEDKENGPKFKSFWGNKATLRRFKDGNIQHCVVWTVNGSDSVVLSIIKYILDFHLHPESSKYLTSNSNILKSKLPTPLLPSSNKQVTTSLNAFVNVKNSFDGLSRALSKLELPLRVKTLLPASSSLRYTSLLQPVPFATSNPDFWNDSVMQFEGSNKWPDEITALENIKSAFLLKASELLNQQTLYEAFLTSDDSIPFICNISLLNVLTPEGYGFRIRVLTDRDEVLFLRAIEKSSKQQALLQDTYLKFNQKYIGSVKHTRTVSSLAHHHLYYSATVRFFKQWLDAHLLLCHLSDELIELIALKPFVDPAPYDVPHSVENGFLQILNFLSHWNWKENPLILDLTKSSDDLNESNFERLSERLTIQSKRVIESNFEKIRRTDPSGVRTQFFIGSKDDPSGILWSNDLNIPIASRLTALARSAMQLIRLEGLNESTADAILKSGLSDYEIVIRTKGSKLTTTSGILPSNAFKNLIGSLNTFPDDLTETYDLIQEYVKDLNTKFGNVILFSTRKFSMVNNRDGNFITGVFIPTSLSPRKFKVTLGIDVKPMGPDGEDVIVNKEAIMDQIRILGSDLIESIYLNK